MNKLETALKDIKADCLLNHADAQKQWDVFCEQYVTLFEKVRLNKPDSDTTHHLLGILTKAHIEAQTLIQHHQESLGKMEQVFKDTLGEEHASRFENQSQKQLIFVTHLWLYIQGYLYMDFSLANDHAEQTAKILSPMSAQQPEALRSEFLGSFYQGIDNSPIEKTTHPILGWLKSLFKS
ncbi:hypothetical protein [Vibrio japonicus]|uniref:Uncharacterized protein n=1 Tax=Vibrio japonicus TaxID=1824638 RepID=A0ABY5LNE7_9VIBR|nr:hypothetical protein [Vibrio japonicus]UUM32951.1 hypothetical protein NP165_15470 [Vibrio japonicus]